MSCWKKQLLEDLKRHEGFRSIPYHDTEGHLTVGYGRALIKNPLSPGEAEYLLSNDIEKSIIGAGGLTSAWSELNDTRKGVLANMVFQMGTEGVSRFKKMLAAIEAADYEKASEEMLDSRWYIQTPNRAIELAEKMRDG